MRSQLFLYPKNISHVHQKPKYRTSKSSKKLRARSSLFHRMSACCQASRITKRRKYRRSRYPSLCRPPMRLLHNFCNRPQSNTCFKLDSDKVLVRVCSLYSASVRVVLAFVRLHLLHFCDYALLADHLSESPMYDAMGKELIYSNIVGDLYATVCDCGYWAQHYTNGKQQRQLSPFFFEGHLKCIGMDIIRPLL